MCRVAGRHDELGLRAFHVRTPVRHDPVAGIRRVAFAAVPHNRVIWNARRDRNRVDRFHKAVVWSEGIHTIRDALELQIARVKGGGFNDGIAHAEERRRGFHKARSNPANPVTREVAATQWRGNEDYAPDFWAVSEDERLGQGSPWRQEKVTSVPEAC